MWKIYLVEGICIIIFVLVFVALIDKDLKNKK